MKIKIVLTLVSMISLKISACYGAAEISDPKLCPTPTLYGSRYDPAIALPLPPPLLAIIFS